MTDPLMYDVTHIDDIGVKYSYLGNNDYAVWMDKETVPYWRVMPMNNIECAGIIRSLADVERIAELEKERIHSVINFLDFCIEKESISKLRMEVAFMHWVKTLKEQGE